MTNTFRFAAISTVFLVVIAGAAEATVDQGDFTSFWEGISWAVVTVTTVGYGDLYPRSVGGRLVAMLLMLVGIGFISVPKHASIAAALARIEGDLAEVKARLDEG